MDSVVTCLAFALAAEFLDMTLVQDKNGSKSLLGCYVLVLIVFFHFSLPLPFLVVSITSHFLVLFGFTKSLMYFGMSF